METFQPISASAVHVLARLAARKAITEQLRAEGVRPTQLKPSELSVRASAYLASHPELWKMALDRAQRMAQEDELRKARRRQANLAVTRSQITQSRPLKRLSFLVQLLRFSEARAY